MQADPAYYGPLPYSPLWMWCGAALLALVAGWFVFVFATTPPDPKPKRTHTALTDLPALKAAYLQRINDVEVDAAGGHLTAREAHQELSLLLRGFVRDATGVDATRMTQQDLARHPLPAAAAVVAVLYPAEFGPDPLPHVGTSAALACEAVRAWT